MCSHEILRTADTAGLLHNATFTSRQPDSVTEDRVPDSPAPADQPLVDGCVRNSGGVSDGRHGTLPANDESGVDDVPQPGNSLLPTAPPLDDVDDQSVNVGRAGARHGDGATPEG